MDRDAVLNRLNSLLAAKRSGTQPAEQTAGQNTDLTSSPVTPSGGLGRRVRLEGSQLTAIKEARLLARAVKWQDKLRYPVDMTQSEIEEQVAERGEPLLAEQIAIASFELMNDYDSRNKLIGMRAGMDMIRTVQADDHAKERTSGGDVNVNIGDQYVLVLPRNGRESTAIEKTP